jgi:hypothetical protein
MWFLSDVKSPATSSRILENISSWLTVVYFCEIWVHVLQKFRVLGEAPIPYLRYTNTTSIKDKHAFGINRIPAYILTQFENLGIRESFDGITCRKNVKFQCSQKPNESGLQKLFRRWARSRCTWPIIAQTCSCRDVPYLLSVMERSMFACMGLWNSKIFLYQMKPQCYTLMIPIALYW